MLDNQNISKSISFLNNLKSKYVLKQLFEYLNEVKFLNIIRYNKIIQNKLSLTLDDYKKGAKIELEIIPIEKKYNEAFINILSDNESCYHIYYNDVKEEIKREKRNYILKDDNIKKIKIIIDYNVNSLKGLFKYCKIIKSISLIRFNITDINNMSEMFSHCSSLKELNLSKFKTNNVKDMSKMFSECSTLKELNISNFITNNVEDMKFLFYKCSSLVNLNLSNFNTNKVKDMNNMFNGCGALKELIYFRIF